ncbi:MAG: MBL fold metallo-hydrolase [Candidatus Latescibacteria bacterium]|nr:MBL fold metallo-hydrolase [Candidatus Latescibacterota bacterium]
MIFTSTVVGELEVNCYLLACEETREGIIVDPGDNVETILQLIKDNNVNIVEIVATHGHFDHIGRVTSLKEATGAPFAIHKADMFMVEGLVDIAAFLGIKTDAPPHVDRFIDENETITFGNKTLNIRYVPGHAPGNIALIWPGHAIVGDTVFAGSIGRTDLEGADPQTLMESIRIQILTLPDDTILHPGHGPDTTVDREKRTNPFLAVG